VENNSGHTFVKGSWLGDVTIGTAKTLVGKTRSLRTVEWASKTCVVRGGKKSASLHQEKSLKKEKRRLNKKCRPVKKKVKLDMQASSRGGLRGGKRGGHTNLHKRGFKKPNTRGLCATGGCTERQQLNRGERNRTSSPAQKGGNCRDNGNWRLPALKG